ncbi:MAG: hypothetical protein K6E47_00260 [Lachnospiraceae bacterium]|nr:hypothetical protein [Lachnospiraceae bacterium]
MNATKRNKKIGLVIVLTLVVSLVCGLGFVPNVRASAASGSCDGVAGHNVDYNNYDTRAAVVTSYLYVCSDGKLMRVQSLPAETDKNPEVLIQYYDSNYNFKSSKRITCDLPIFGGFYAMSNGYYILSGQSNPNEDNSVEVYRITKYDLSWNRISSVGLYGANTYSPFQAGSARFDSKDNYLAVRTCHTMYASSDGLHHQANVSILIDTTNMEITDKHYAVAYSGAGYCSHSFNQYVRFDGNRFIGVDHGDAYPRSVAIFKSKSTTLGKFSGSHDYQDLLPITGNTGDNYTGVSVGGFEMSSSNYLVVGNSTDQDNWSASKTRNVFVSVIGKDFTSTSGSSVVRYITGYPEGGKSAKTPVLVKINDSRFLVLWSVSNSSEVSDKETIYYVEIDGAGNKVGSVHTMTGHLSDCQPIVTNGKVIWYTWDDNDLTFYEISTSNISSTNSVTVTEGHVIPASAKADSNGVVSYTCERCGKKLSFTVPNSCSDWWNSVAMYTSYSSYPDSVLDVGDVLYLWYQVSGDYDVYSLAYSISDPSKCVFEANSLGGTFTMLKPGTLTISVWPKYNPSLTKSYLITINGTAENEIVIDKQPQNATVEEGKIAYFSVKATGEGLSYLWQYKYAGSSTWTDWTSKKTADISVAYAANRDGMSLRCVVTDSFGESVTSDEAVLKYKEAEVKFAITGQPVSSTVESGNIAYFEVKATGKGMKYLWQYKNAGSSNWTNWTSKTTAKISVAYADYRDGMSLRCVVTDASGSKLTSDTAVLTYNTPFAITTQPVNAVVNENELAYFSVKATGKGLKYLWQYKNAGSSNWTDWTSKKTASISVAYADYRDGMSLRCVITDANGSKLTSDVAVLKYNIPLAILTQPQSTTVKTGNLAYFSVKASGKNLKYLWQYKNAGDSTWTDWTSKKTASISVAYATYRNGMQVRCIVTDYEGKKLTSDAATLYYN